MVIYMGWSERNNRLDDIDSILNDDIKYNLGLLVLKRKMMISINVF